MKALAFIDVLTTMNDLSGGNNCPVAFIVDVFEEEYFFAGGANPKSKTIFMIPDEPVLGSGFAFHGITNEALEKTVVPKPLPLSDGLEKAYEILSAFSKNGIYVAGYGLKSFDLKILNDSFVRVLKKPAVEFKKEFLIDVERLSKLLVDVRICGNYNQSSVLASLNYSAFESLRGILPNRRRISETEILFRELVNKFQAGTGLDGISDFLSRRHDVEIFQSGKYKGMRIEDVYNIDRQYFTWILKNRDFYENDPDMIMKVESIVNTEE